MKLLRKVGTVGVAILALSATGCGNKDAQKAAGNGMVHAGTVIARVPHPYAKVLGVALIAAGTSLVVQAEMADGSKQAFEIPLDAEQKKKLDAGGEVEIMDPNGKVVKVKPVRQ